MECGKGTAPGSREGLVTTQETTAGENTSGLRQPAGRFLWVPLVSLWMLLSATLSLPGRTGPQSLGSLDAVALYKVGVRGLVVILLALATLMLRRYTLRTAERRGFTLLGLFVLWSLASCFWSPLPAFSTGQAMTLATLFLLAVTLALAWRSGRDTSTVLRQLSVAFLLYCAALAAVHLVNPAWSGLARESGEPGAMGGLVHPTAGGGTASLGLVLVVACRLIWDWRWTRVLLPPSLVVFPTVMLMAASRTALGAAFVVIAVMVCRMGSRPLLFVLALVASLGGIMYPLADPGLEAVRAAVSNSEEFARRGESTETLRGLNGRTELWTLVRASFLEAPLVGHGYFVTSKEGAIDVWDGPANHSAHNMFLQVAVSTGLIGLTLFLGGLWRLIAVAFRRLGSSDEGRRLRTATMVLGLWYLGWSALSESFMGPLTPEAVLAFSLFGLIAGFREPHAT